MNSILKEIVSYMRELIAKVEAGTASENDKFNLAVLTDCVKNLKAETE